MKQCVLTGHLYVIKRIQVIVDIQIVFKNSVVLHINFHVRKLFKYIFSKTQGLRFQSFTLITCIPVCIMTSFLFFYPLPIRFKLHLSQSPTKELCSFKVAFFPSWIIESVFSRFTYLYLLHCTFLLTSWHIIFLLSFI